MPPHPRLRAAAALAALPVAALLALAAFGELAWGPALAAAAVVLSGTALLTWRWARYLDRIVQQAERSARALNSRIAELEELLRVEQDIVQRLPDPLIVLGADRAVLRANAAAHAAFGAGMAAVLRHPGLRGAIDRAHLDGRDQVAQLTLPVPIGQDVHATVLALHGPPARHTVAVLSDRTRERAVERMRADFVANASHELRTPLASLIGFIETLQGPAANDPAGQTRFLAIMAEQAQRMNRLIDDLLSLSRIELTEHQPPSDRVAIRGLVERMAEAFGPQLAARRIRLDVQLPPELPIVPGDADQLEQVLQNLLDNAVKYGREGGTIRLSAQPAAPGDGVASRAGMGAGVALTVQDDGQGIARLHIPRLTERFYRADAHRSRAVGGTGLGLAIVKHIVNRHRGRMAIESIEGAGTTVTVWLPLVGAGTGVAGPA